MKECAYRLLMTGVMLILFGCNGKRYDVVPVPIGTTQSIVIPDSKEVDASKVIAIKIDRETGKVWVIDEYKVEYETKASIIP